MAKIIFLGTSASIPTRNRDNTSFAFIQKKDLFLIDCPGALPHKLLRTGIDFKKVKNIIITHHHPDHFYGIFGLIHAQAYLNKNLNVFSNTPTIELLKELLKKMGLTKKSFPKVTFLNVFKSKKTSFYANTSLKIKAIKNKHIRDSFGVVFSWGKKRILYSSDTAKAPEIIKEAKSCDYLIHDCTASSSFFKKYPRLYRMHTDSKSLARVFKDTPLKKIIPVHFLLLRKGEEERIKKELEVLGEKLLLVSDFDSLSF